MLEEEAVPIEWHDYAETPVVLHHRRRPAVQLLEILAALLVKDLFAIAACNFQQAFPRGGLGLVTEEGDHVAAVWAEHHILDSTLCLHFIDEANGAAIAGGERHNIGGHCCPQ